MRHLVSTKMMRKGRQGQDCPEADRSSFTLTKAMVLASTDFKQRSGINSAASFAIDGHSVDLSEELVEQKPSIVRSEEWETAPKPVVNTASAGIIRVCWQCPEASTALAARGRV